MVLKQRKSCYSPILLFELLENRLQDLGCLSCKNTFELSVHMLGASICHVADDFYLILIFLNMTNSQVYNEPGLRQLMVS